MQCASLLREAMWSMVSELYLDAPGTDYVAYTDENLERLAADLVIDGVIEADALREELLHRLRYAARRDRHFSSRHRAVPPV